MIYPINITEGQKTELKVYNILKNLPDQDYTVFFNQEFVSDPLSKQKTQYEIDFLITYHPNSSSFEGLLVLEVKGGNILYNKIEDVWFQSGRKMKKSPVIQVTSSMHSLIRRYFYLIKNVNVSWGLCFADVEIPDNAPLPNNLTRERLFDDNDLNDIQVSLEKHFSLSKKQLNKIGGTFNDFENLRTELLKGCNFFKPLHKEIKENNEKFFKLTNQQSKIIKFLKDNNNFCIQGPAGSGKTLIAYQQALEYKRQGLNVFFTTFNKQIAKHLRNLVREELDLNENEGKLNIFNFHSWASRLAKENPNYNKEKKDGDYFNTYIPNKALEVLKTKSPEYDILIVDEGQDFRQNWLDLLNNTLKKEGKFLIFMDENQDIFGAYKGVPNHRNIVKLNLEENCRNTNKIIDFLNTIIKDCNILPMEGTPEGSEVVISSFNDNNEQINYLKKEVLNLIENQKVSPSQIIILTNNTDKESSLRGINKIGSYNLKSTYDRNFGKDNTSIFHSTINTFKGLESEIVFILDTQNVITNDKVFYTQASRAKNKLFINYIK